MTPVECLKAAREQYRAGKYIEAAGIVFNIFVKESDIGTEFFNPKFKIEEYRDLIILSLDLVKKLTGRQHCHVESLIKLHLAMTKISLDLDLAVKAKRFFDYINAHKSKDYFKNNDALVSFYDELEGKVNDRVQNFKPLTERQSFYYSINLDYFFRRGNRFVIDPTSKLAELDAEPERMPKNFRP